MNLLRNTPAGLRALIFDRSIEIKNIPSYAFVKLNTNFVILAFTSTRGTLRVHLKIPNKKMLDYKRSFRLSLSILVRMEPFGIIYNFVGYFQSKDQVLSDDCIFRM